MAANLYLVPWSWLLPWLLGDERRRAGVLLTGAASARRRLERCLLMSVRFLALAYAVTLLVLLGGTVSWSAPWQLELDAAGFSRYLLMDPQGNGLHPS